MGGVILGLVRRDHECARSDGRDGDGAGEGVDFLWGRFCARGVAGELVFTLRVDERRLSRDSKGSNAHETYKEQSGGAVGGVSRDDVRRGDDGAGAIAVSVAVGAESAAGGAGNCN